MTYSLEDIKVNQAKALAAWDGDKSVSAVARDAGLDRGTLREWLLNDRAFIALWKAQEMAEKERILSEGVEKRRKLAYKVGDVAEQALDAVDVTDVTPEQAFKMAGQAIENLGEVTGTGKGKDINVNVNPPPVKKATPEEMKEIQRKLGG